MGGADLPTSNDVLQSLRLLRSADAAERKRGIAILSGLHDDPRVQQVFEHLYEKDPDPTVREAAWRAINAVEPAIPAPTVAAEALPEPSDSDMAGPVLQPAPTRVAAPTVKPAAPAQASPPAASAKSAKAARRQTTSRRAPAVPKAQRARAARPLFLLDPANAALVARDRARVAASRRSGGGAYFMLALIVLVVAVILAVVSVQDLYRRYQLNQDGVQVQGVVTGREEDNKYTVRYQYDTGGASSYAYHQTVTQADYDRLSADAPVTVIYLPDDPGVSRLDLSDPNFDLKQKMGIAAVALAAIALLFALLGLLMRGRGRRVPRRVVMGRLVACEGSADDDGDFKVRLRYKFRAPNGAVIEGRASQIRNDLRQRKLPRPGTSVAVWYRSEKSYKLL